MQRTFILLNLVFSAQGSYAAPLNDVVHANVMWQNLVSGAMGERM